MRNYLFLPNDYFDLTIYQYGYEQCKPFHSFGPAMRNHYLIHCILSGKGVYRTSFGENAAEYHLTLGQAFLIEPNKIVHYSADEAEPWEYIWIEFDGLKAKDYLNQSGLSEDAPIFHANSEDGHNKVFCYLKHMVDFPDILSVQTMGYAYLFFGALIENSVTAKPLYKNDIKEFYMKSTVDFIENYYMKNITVEDMAGNLRLDRSYFSKLFKKMTDKSPQEFLISYRINKACELLRSTDLPIAEIATMAGYSNQFHFARAFKRIMKIPPNKWRKQIGKYKH